MHGIGTVLVSGEYKHFGEKLESLGHKVYYTKADLRLPKPIQYHSDIQVLPFTDNNVFILKGSGVNLNHFTCIETLKEPKAAYPLDCLLNGFFIGDNFCCNVNAIDFTVLDLVKRHNFTVKHVNQGYAKCSVCIINDFSVITADTSIAKVMGDVKVLKIEEGHIDLPGYDYGFIGGASGKIGNTVYFTGSLKFHPNGKEIESFILNEGMEICELSQNKLIDIGGIVNLIPELKLTSFNLK